MSLFVTSLSFTDPSVLATAKLSIITASVLSGIVGTLILRSKTY